ncbi:hypothetical protein EON83_06710 [bacterium]|nr:MAG: hypothetical protein EON83_06710 [bacterium]
MGLFNRTKGDAPAPSTLGEVTPPADSNNFDFDAISRDLDAQNGASSFDSLLAAPVSPEQRKLATESAGDFPENDHLGLLPPPTTAATPISLASSPEAVINAPINPPASPTTGVAPTPTVARPLSPSVTKKPLPLVPLLGVLGVLAVVGGGAMFLLSSNNQEVEPVAPPPRVATNPGAPPAPVNPVAPPTAGVPVMPPQRDAPLPPNTADTGMRSASPGIAPKPGPKIPVGAVKGSSNVSIVVGQRPTNNAPSATADIDPALASKLKALWRAGADAKHRRDFQAARTAWGEALRLRPGHPGFQDSINKLPR